MLIVAFNADLTTLIQLYVVGVFVSFTISQPGMVRHWTRHLKTETSRPSGPDDAVPGDQRGRSDHDRRGAGHRAITKFLLGA